MAIKKREKWTEDEILFLPPLEHDCFERKRGAFLQNKDFRKDFAKAISAFANSGGGHLIIGVQDDGTIDGVPEMYNKKIRTRDWLEQIIPQSVGYELQDFRVHEVEPSKPSQVPPGNVVIVIDVGDSIFAPHQSSEDHLYYHRSGGRSRPAPHFYLEMIRARETYLNRNLVRVWFDTVINLMLSELLHEKRSLIKKHWSWDHYRKFVNSVCFLNHDNEDLYGVYDNQEQFLNLYPKVKNLINEHDNLARHFVVGCKDLYEVIKNSAYLRKIYRQCTSAKEISKLREALIEKGRNVNKEYDDKRIISEFFFDAEEERHLEVLADMIINHEQNIGSEDRAKIFWNYSRDKFLTVLDKPRISSKNEALVISSQQLLETNINLIDELRRIRRELGVRYGVPYSSPTPSLDNNSYYR